MRLAARVDANHGAIKDAFERLGCAVLDLSRIGRSVPDLLVSMGCVSCLVEVKTPKGRVKANQAAFAARWGGWTAVARDMGDVEQIASRMRQIHARTA